MAFSCSSLEPSLFSMSLSERDESTNDNLEHNRRTYLPDLSEGDRSIQMVSGSLIQQKNKAKKERTKSSPKRIPFRIKKYVGLNIRKRSSRKAKFENIDLDLCIPDLGNQAFTSIKKGKTALTIMTLERKGILSSLYLPNIEGNSTKGTSLNLKKFNLTLRDTKISSNKFRS